MDRLNNSKRRLAVYLSLAMVLAVFIGLVKLGLWQLERAEQKQRLQQTIALNSQRTLNAFPLGDVDENYNKRVIEVSGQLLHQYTWLLDNQVYQGQVGYHVLVAMQLDSSPQLALVDLGWVAAPIRRTELPALLHWPKPQRLTGQLYIAKSNPYTLIAPATQGWPKRIAEVDITQMSTQVNQPFHTAIMRVNQHSDIGYVKDWRWGNNMTIEKHQAYAFQWFALSITLLLLTGYFVKRQTKEV